MFDAIFTTELSPDFSLSFLANHGAFGNTLKEITAVSDGTSF